MIEKILIEINRLKNELDGYSAREALDYIESYINTLPKSKLKNPTKSEIPKDLEEAAKECNSNLQLQGYFIKGGIWQKEKDNEVADKALTTSIKLQEGWYAKGIADGEKSMKEQMMKEAVEGEVCGRVYDHINVRFADGVCKYLEPKNISHIPADVSKYNIGQKVRIIVCKKED